MKNNISDLAPKRKSDFEKVKNIHVGKNKRMCRAYEIVIA